jgi:hypothetical protein
MSKLRLFVLLVAVAPAVARAAGPDPERELARRHYDRGAALYEAGQFGDALAAFETARRFKALPPLDYNIARCHERMEEWAAAVEAYRRYLGATPPPTDGGAIRERIALLQKRVDAAAEAHRPPRRDTAAAPAPVATRPPLLLPSPAVRVSPAVPFGPSPPPPPGRRWRLWAPVAAAAVVAVALGVGLGVGLGAAPHDAPPVHTTLGTMPVGFGN